jgi:hypothetical protein
LIAKSQKAKLAHRRAFRGKNGLQAAWLVGFEFSVAIPKGTLFGAMRFADCALRYGSRLRRAVLSIRSQALTFSGASMISRSAGVSPSG